MIYLFIEILLLPVFKLSYIGPIISDTVLSAATRSIFVAIKGMCSFFDDFFLPISILVHLLCNHVFLFSSSEEINALQNFV